MKRFAHSLSLAILYAASLVGAIGGEAETGTKSSTKEQTLQFLHDLLPVAWQKRPMQRFNVFTEMTEEGRKQRLPSPAQPMYYYSPSGRFVQLGEVVGGEKPPPTAELEAAIRKELAASGYLPIANDQQRPDLLILLAFGSTGRTRDRSAVPISCFPRATPWVRSQAWIGKHFDRLATAE